MSRAARRASRAGAPRQRAPRPIRLRVGLDRRGVEALVLEARRLARSRGLAVRAVEVRTTAS